MNTRVEKKEGKNELQNPYRSERVIFKFEAWFFAIPYIREKKRKPQRLCTVTYMSSLSLFSYVTQQGPWGDAFLLLHPHLPFLSLSLLARKTFCIYIIIKYGYMHGKSAIKIDSSFYSTFSLSTTFAFAFSFPPQGLSARSQHGNFLFCCFSLRKRPSNYLAKETETFWAWMCYYEASAFVDKFYVSQAWNL